MFKDYYSILQISPLATVEEIRQAYRDMSKKWHPDKNPGVDVTNIMQDINEAYAILEDPTKKARYDNEYRRFKAQSTVRTHPMSNTGTDAHSQSYTYTYDVQDESLKNDMTNARTYAQELVNEFLKSLRNTSKQAAKGAWDSAKSYVLVAIILTIIGFLIMMCSRTDEYSTSQYSDPYDYQSENLTSYEKQGSQAVKKLSPFKTPDTWSSYTLNESFSISVPNTVELRHDYDKYTQLHKNVTGIGETYYADLVVFQQKGLANESSDYDRHYCRIMIMHSKGVADDFLRFYEIEPIDIETAAFLRELVTNELGGYAPIGEPTYEWIDISGTKAIEIKYRRKGNQNYTTSCTIYLLFNYDEMVKMVIAYREQERNLWLPDLDNVIKTFKWT